MPVGFAYPAWLLVGLAVLPAAWIAGRWFLSMSRVRRWVSVGVRGVLFAAIAALLAGAVLVRESDRLAIVAVVDVSESVRRFAGASDAIRQSVTAGAVDQVRGALAEASSGRSADDLLGIVVFDGRAVAIATPTRTDPLDRTFDIPMADGTDIGSALRYAASMIPSDAAGRLLLFSDGNETEGNAVEAANELVSRLVGAGGGRSGLPIDVVPLQYDLDREVIVESVDVPPTAESGSVVPVRVVLRSAGSAEGVLRLLRGGVEIDISPGVEGLGRRVRLGPGRAVEVAQAPLETGRVHRFEAVWEPRVVAGAGGGSVLSGDTRTENNRASGVTISPGRGEVLLVDGVGRGAPTGGGALLAGTLRAAGIGVTSIDPSAMPDDLLSLQAYDLVVLQDVPADEMSQRAQAALAAHVQDLGAGLVMLGGYNSFAAGGWRGSVIEPLLPVELEIPDDLITPSAAVMIVLDSSGSMGRSVMGSVRTKQEIANESAALAVSTLDDRDLIGVLSFNSSTREVVPIGRNLEPESTSDRIRSISAGGGTVIGPALGLARDGLVGVEADLKHIILLSDGQSADADDLPGMAEAMGRLGIKITTISVGSGAHEETMRVVAARSGGEHYAVMNANTLPRVFVRAIRVVQSPLVREAPFLPRIVAPASPLVEGIAGSGGEQGSGALPALGGLSLTRAKVDPTVTTAMATGGGEPVLAHWQVGLGKVAVFTSDARSDNWAGVWSSWPGFGRFWTSLVRHVSRPTTAGPYELQIVRDGGGVVLRLDAANQSGDPIDYLTVPATVYDDSGMPREVLLGQVGPGEYEARLDDLEPGQVVAVVRPRLGQNAMAPVVGGVTIESNAEFRRLHSDDALLTRLAGATGGRVLSIATPDKWGVFDRTGVPPRVTMLPVFLPLIVLVLGLLLLDVATRRVAWDRFVSHEFGVDLRRSAAEATRDRGEQAGRALSGIRAGRGVPAERAADESEAGLGEQSAARVIAEARERRAREEAERLRRLREEMLGKPAGGGSASPDRDARNAEQPAPQKHHEEDSGPGGLLEAKRRARERFEPSEGDE